MARQHYAGITHQRHPRTLHPRTVNHRLTSNPSSFDHAIRDTGFYDEAIRGEMHAAQGTEKLFFELALEDLTDAADLFRPAHDATSGVDGWVSLEVSPLLAD